MRANAARTRGTRSARSSCDRACAPDARTAFARAIERVATHPMARIGLVAAGGEAGLTVRRPARLSAPSADRVLSVESAVVRAAQLVDGRRSRSEAALLVEEALAVAPPGNAGWLLPIEPLLQRQRPPGCLGARPRPPPKPRRLNDHAVLPGFRTPLEHIQDSTAHGWQRVAGARDRLHVSCCRRRLHVCETARSSCPAGGYAELRSGRICHKDQDFSADPKGHPRAAPPR